MLCSEGLFIVYPLSSSSLQKIRTFGLHGLEELKIVQIAIFFHLFDKNQDKFNWVNEFKAIHVHNTS